MYDTQLLKIKIRPGMTEKVVAFIRTLQERKAEALEALRREGMLVETLFLERRDDGDFLYYYVKARSLAHANEVNMQATDPLSLEIRRFVCDTWGEIASPEPLLDLHLIPEAPKKAKDTASRPAPAAPRRSDSAPKPRMAAPPASAAVTTTAAPAVNAPHVLAGG